MQDREARKANLIILNAAEPGPTFTTGTARKDHDLDFIRDLCDVTETKCCVDTEIKFINRTGEKPKDNKPRPIIVGFRDIATRDSILNNAYKLKGSTLEYLRVMPDLTKMQRSEEQELYDEVERRNAQLTGDELNFQWLVVGPKGGKRLRKVRKTQMRNKRRNSRSPPGPSRTRQRQETREPLRDDRDNPRERANRV